MSASMFSLIQCFFIVFLSAILFVCFICTNKYFKNNVLRYFLVASLAVILLAICDAAQGFYETLDYPTNARKFFASCGYSLRPCVLYIISLLFTRNLKKKYKILVSSVIIVNTIICFLSFATDVVFYYTEKNELVRGPLLVFPFISCIFYFLFFIFVAIKGNRVSTKKEAFLVSIIFVCAIFVTLLELIFRFQGVLATFSMIAIIFYYMFFLSDNYSLDQLTGAYIRTKLYEDTENLKKPYAIIEIDVNDLKVINDNFGHQAGDKCLSTIINIVRSHLPVTANVYRIGGDEFIIIYKTLNEESIKELITNFKADIEKNNYSIAAGYTIKNPNESFDSAESRADKNMYIDKNIVKVNRT